MRLIGYESKTAEKNSQDYYSRRSVEARYFIQAVVDLEVAIDGRKSFGLLEQDRHWGVHD